MFHEAVKAAADVVRNMTAVVNERKALVARRVDENTAAAKALDRALAERKTAETTDAVAAAIEGRSLPELATFDAKVRQAELAKSVADKLVDDAQLALEIAEDELEEATQARRRAACALAAHRLSQTLEAAIPFDDELQKNGGGNFDVAARVEDARAYAEQYAQPLPAADIEIEVVHYTDRGDDFQSKYPLDRAIEAVAGGSYYFANPRHARKYAAQVEALKAEIAAKPKHNPRTARAVLEHLRVAADFPRIGWG